MLRQRKRNPEHDEQVRLIKAARALESAGVEGFDMLYAVPNGGHRNEIVGAKMKAEGQRAGVPDLCLPVPRNGFHGMYIEMKAGKNKQTPTQREYMEKLMQHGYHCVVCYTAQEAMHYMLWYLGTRLHFNVRNALALNGLEAPNANASSLTALAPNGGANV